MQGSISLKNKLTNFLSEHSSKRKVIIVNSYDKIAMLAGIIEGTAGYLGDNTDILCFKARIPEEFDDFADKVKISEDYLAYEDYLKIDNYVFKDITKNWDREAKEKYRDIFTYRDIELARIPEYDFQIFLIAKIKTVAVLKRAIKKEGYKAVFIIDSNDELDNFDRLLSRQYSIPSVLVKIEDRVGFLGRMRKCASSVLSNAVDGLASVFVPNKKDAKLIDARLFFHELRLKDMDNFILTPLEKGLKLRLKSFFKGRGYIAFDTGRDMARAILPKRSSVIHNFDIRTLADKFIFEDISYWELVENEVKSIIWCDFNKIRKNVDILLKEKKAHNLKCVVLRIDNRIVEKGIVLLSNQIDIKTVVVYYGVPQDPNGHDIIFADKITVWGKRDIHWFEKLGNDPAKVVVVGKPLGSNKISDNAKPKQDEGVINRLGLAKRRFLITLIGPGRSISKISSFTTDDVTGVLIREVKRAIKSVGDANLIVKLHPNEKAKVYKGFNDESTVVIEKINLDSLLEESDLVIIKDSTVGLDAVIMRKPLIAINLTRRQDFVPYADKGVAIGVQTKEEIEGAIRKALYDENIKRDMDSSREDFIADFAYKIDGKSTERVLRLLGSQ